MNQSENIAPPVAPRGEKSQRGIALLLTLGILSLLLIIAMAFAYTSRTERMAAAINADMVRARLMCESGVERTLAYLQYTYPYAAGNEANLYPATKSTGFFESPLTAADWNWSATLDRQYFAVSQANPADATLIETALAANFGFDLTPNWKATGYTAYSNANKSWQHISTAAGELVGRVAFLMIDDSGKIDPNRVTNRYEPFIDSDNSGACNGTEPYYDWNASGTWTNAPINEGSEVRFGYDISEVNLANALPSGMDTSAIATEFLMKVPVPGGVPYFWTSWQQLWKGGGVPANSAPPVQITSITTSPNIHACVRALFPFSYDVEAFHAPADALSKHRFNLNSPDPTTPVTWDTLTVAQLMDPTNVKNFWDTSTSPWTITAAPTIAIPWLIGIQDTAGTGSLTGVVCANLIDYCDTNSIPTNSGYTVASGGWDTTRTVATLATPASGGPAYVGLEKVAYINEVAFTVAMSDPLSPPAPASSRQVDITVYVELANIYDDAAYAGGSLVMDVAFADIPGGSLPNGPTASPSGATYTWATVNVPANGYQTLTSSTTYSWTGANALPSFNIGAITISLLDGTGALIDFSTIDAYAPLLTLSSGQVKNIHAEVKDPRCNTAGTGTNWIWSVGTQSGGVNSGSNPSTAGGDTETATDPTGAGGTPKLSTAYIRNAPMQSPWELGCIHRGEAFQTLNLAKYNAVAPFTYASGDAAILDQVKIGPQTTCSGKFNANSPYKTAWRAVVAGVTVGAIGATPPATHGYDAPSTGTAITVTDATTIADNILTQNGTLGGSTPNPNRGAIAKAVKLSDGTVVTQTNDRMKEEIIGKIANLLTTRQNYYTLIITAQSVKDLGTVAVTTPGVVQYGAGTYCRVLAEQKMMAIVYRDAYTNKFRIDRMLMLDDQ